MPTNPFKPSVDRARRYASGGTVSPYGRHYADGGGELPRVPGAIVDQDPVVANSAPGLSFQDEDYHPTRYRKGYLDKLIRQYALAGRDPESIPYQAQQRAADIATDKDLNVSRNAMIAAIPAAAPLALAASANPVVGSALLASSYGMVPPRRDPNAVSDPADSINAALAMSMPFTARAGARVWQAIAQNPGKAGAALTGLTSLGATQRNRPSEPPKEKPGSVEIKAREEELKAQMEARARLDEQMKLWNDEMKAQGSDRRGGPGNLYKDLLAKIAVGQQQQASSDAALAQARRDLNDLRVYWSDQKVTERAKEEERQWRGKPMAEKFEAMTGLPSSTMPFAIGSLVSAPIVGALQSGTNRAYNNIISNFNKAVGEEKWAEAALHQNAMKQWEGLGWKNAAKGASHLIAGGLPLEVGGAFRYGYDTHRDPTTEGGKAISDMTPMERWVDYGAMPLLSSVIAGGTGWKIGNALPRRQTEYGRAIAGVPPGGSGRGGPGGAGGGGPAGGPENPLGPYSGAATLSEQHNNARALGAPSPQAGRQSVPALGNTPATQAQGPVLVPPPQTQRQLPPPATFSTADLLERMRLQRAQYKPFEPPTTRPPLAEEVVVPPATPVTPAPGADLAKDMAKNRGQYKPLEAPDLPTPPVEPAPLDPSRLHPVTKEPLPAGLKTNSAGQIISAHDGTYAPHHIVKAPDKNKAKVAKGDKNKAAEEPVPPEEIAGTILDKNGKPVPVPKKPDMPIPGSEEGHARGGFIKGALAKARQYARGGLVGPIRGHTPGRADAVPADVPSGSFVIPSDVVAGRGQGNSDAGQQYFDAMGKRALAKMSGRRMTEREAGGSVGAPVKARVAHGEHILPPEVVWAMGGGDLKQGHAICDAMVKQCRAEDIKTLQALPPPVKD